MVRRRSLKRKSLKKQFKKGRRSRKKHFGKDKKVTKNVFSSILENKNLQAFQLYVKKLVPNILQNLKPDEEIKEEHLSCGQKIKRYFERIFIKWFKPSIDKVIESLNANQIVLLLKGEYNKQLRNSILWKSELENVDSSQINGLDKLKLMILQSKLGTSIVTNIKMFIKSLSPQQMVKLINGDFDLYNALINGFLGTKYPTTKELKAAAKE